MQGGVDDARGVRASCGYYRKFAIAENSVAGGGWGDHGGNARNRGGTDVRQGTQRGGSEGDPSTNRVNRFSG